MKWCELAVAPCRTHHLRHGVPAYSPRYIEVGKFHDPGLAPALDDSGALHISANGLPAYADRFSRTFGFYEGRAAVQASDGWRHLFPDGTSLSEARFAWCGNFQSGRCTVRSFDNHYYHVTLEGLPAYSIRWKYAGDFRDGIAVVQASNGLHTHLDAEGRRIHGKWFHDLGVYHKGYAAARDDAGWTHIDRAGNPLYSPRFAAAEPFYNGQARVLRHDGSLAVVDERGVMMVQLRGAQISELSALKTVSY